MEGLLKKILQFVGMCACTSLFECYVCAPRAFRCAQRVDEGIRSPETGVTSECELPAVGGRN